MTKSTVDEIRERFDADVERFANLQTGQEATVDSALAMELVASAAARVTPRATHVLDVGCGAGNYTLKLLEHVPDLDVTLIDLSQPMLDRAFERVSAATKGEVVAIRADVREFEIPPASVDIVLAAAVLHHLRTDSEWNAVFRSFARSLRSAGSAWIFDLVRSSIPAIEQLQQERWGDYLVSLKDESYRDDVFAYVQKEDTPRPLVEQLDCLRTNGFAAVDVLHATHCFAAFGGVVDKSAER